MKKKTSLLRVENKEKEVEGFCCGHCVRELDDLVRAVIAESGSSFHCTGCGREIDARDFKTISLAKKERLIKRFIRRAERRARREKRGLNLTPNFAY